MELGVGEYVRNEIGQIARIIGKSEEIDIGWFMFENNPNIWYKPNRRLTTAKIIKHSINIIDLIEDEDIVILEYKSPKYRERITRKFEVSKIDDDISFENAHCNFRCKIGDEKIKDDICKNIKIKSVVTKEQFSNIEYIVEE